jgi:hypothetical protein
LTNNDPSCGFGDLKIDVVAYLLGLLGAIVLILAEWMRSIMFFVVRVTTPRIIYVQETHPFVSIRGTIFKG